MAKQFAPDPSIGIWKLNVHKSNFVLVPAPKGSVMKVEAWQDGMKMSADTIDADGNKMHQPFTSRTGEHGVRQQAITDNHNHDQTNDCVHQFRGVPCGA